ncbi:hypothetical protein OHR68_06995 [Spirillospora sp. NBC_00431]
MSASTEGRDGEGADGSGSDLIVTAPNGVTWKRLPGATTGGTEFLAALKSLAGFDDVARQWNVWEEGQRDKEHQQLIAVLKQWNHASPPPGGYLSSEELEARWDAREKSRDEARRARADLYDQERAHARIGLLQAKATAGFMGLVAERPASAAQRDMAAELEAASLQEAEGLREQVGDPDTVVDRHGDLPATRREQNLSDHMSFFRHRLLREWSVGQRKRFNQLLAMPVPRGQDMCSECQAPADWHRYAISVCLWRQQPQPGTEADTLARLLPGWLERCIACTPYQLRHQWGGAQALPGFDGEQWRKMLTPFLRAIFAPGKPARRTPVDERAVLERRLRAAEAEAERLRKQLAEHDPGGRK